MSAKKPTAARIGDGSIVLTKDTHAKLTDLMDELAFRGPMQEALIMRVANLAGFAEVITRIKRRRLYTKKMDAGRPAVDDVVGVSATRPHGKKKGKKRPRPTKPPADGGQQGEGTTGG